METVQKIGTNFKLENIYLGTIICTPKTARDVLNRNISDDVMEVLELSVEQYDIFYKDENGYTRFVESGPETFKGDNSDGKGIIRNLVPILRYYKEEELEEVMIDSFMTICVSDLEPLEQYNRDYNL